MRFCPRCGKKDIKETFCKACSSTELDLKFKEIKVVACTSCKKFLSKNKWMPYIKIKDAAKTIAESKISNPSNIPLTITPKIPIVKHNPGVHTPIEIQITNDDRIFELPGSLEFTLCPLCSKQGTQYLEGVLQLRDCPQEVYKFVKEDIDSKDGVFITKQTKVKDGIDLEITSKKYLRALAKRLKQHFGGTINESAKLFSRNKQTSKDIFRLNILFRIPPHKIGDIVKKGSQEIVIKSIGKRTSGTDKKTGKRVFLD